MPAGPRGPRPAAIVLPVRDGRLDLERHLPGFLAQADAARCSVVVVDDASDDGSADIAAQLGAQVIRLEQSAGPYVARNQGWRAVDTPVVVFVDVRCSPRVGWLAALLTGLAENPQAAIAGGDVVVARRTGTAAERWAARDRRLDLRRHLEDGFLPYVPTANMAVRRPALEALGGFREIRSGGDVDLCWRAQLEGVGGVVGVPDAVLEMIPRASMGAVVRQWRRYGLAHFELWQDYAWAGCPVPPPTPRRVAAKETARAVAGLVARRRTDVAVEVVEWARLRAYRRAYRQQWRRHAGR